MSKRSLFWGNASGKLGEAVFYRAGGEQRTRTWVSKIKNPRTKKQAIQRTKLNNLTALYKSIASFIKQVNQPEKSSMTAFNQFVKNNAQSNEWIANKSMIDNGFSASQNLQLSRGDLNVPTGYNNPTGASTFDLGTNGTAIGSPSLENPFMFVMDNPLPEVEFEGTQSATEKEQKRGFLYGKEIFQIFSGGGNIYNLPPEYAVFIVVSQYADEGFVTKVLGVTCSVDSNDKLHLVASSNSSRVKIGEAYAYLMPIDGTMTKGTETANMKLSGTTQYYLSDGNTATYTPNVDEQAYGICVAYRDETGIHASKCNLYSPSDSRYLDYVNQFLPDGEAGFQILSEYETATNTLV